MTKIYKKSEITFAILWIVLYVVLSSLADQLSESVGIVKSVTAVLHVVMSLILLLWIRKSGLGEKTRTHVVSLVFRAGKELERGMRAETSVFDLENLSHAAFTKRADELPSRDLLHGGAVVRLCGRNHRIAILSYGQSVGNGIAQRCGTSGFRV